MKLIVVAVRDRAADAYMRPFVVPSVGMAVRSFSDEVNRKSEDNQMWKHADDFDLYKLGEFDEDSGALVGSERPEQICIGKNVRVSE